MSCSCYPSLTLAPQVRRSELEADLRPVTPSKIPVGAFRVEEEKAINRALTGGAQDSNRQKSPLLSPSPGNNDDDVNKP